MRTSRLYLVRRNSGFMLEIRPWFGFPFVKLNTINSTVGTLHVKSPYELEFMFNFTNTLYVDKRLCLVAFILNMRHIITNIVVVVYCIIITNANTCIHKIVCYNALNNDCNYLLRSVNSYFAQ